MNDSNLIEVSEEIDEIRFEKERQLAASLGIPDGIDFKAPSPHVQDLEDAINNEVRFKSFSREQQEKVREIKFLHNVAATVAHR